MFSVNDILSNDRSFNKMSDTSLLNLSVEQIYEFLHKKSVSDSVLNACRHERIDGKALLILNERDVYRLEHKYHLLLGDIKRFLLLVNQMQQQNRNCLIFLGILDNQNNLITNLLSHHAPVPNNFQHHPSIYSQDTQIDRISPANSVDGSSSGRQYATCIQPEFFKALISLGERLSLVFFPIRGCESQALVFI